MIETGEQAIKGLTDREVIESVIQEHLSAGHAISMWRLPGSSKKNLLVSTEGITYIDQPSIEELEAGFIFAPYNPTAKKLFLKGNLIFEIESEKGQITVLKGGSKSDGTNKNISNKKNQLPFFKTELASRPKDDKNKYLETVEKAIEAIQKGVMEKIVPGRGKEIHLEQSFSLVESFNRLCGKYPNAFVSLVSTRESGTWLGASPELLVSVDKDNKFKTAAVAGTQALTPDADLRQIAWTQKEIEEQALVSRYIINCFKKIRLREFQEHGPKTWKAGNLLHLKTDFEVDMNATNFPLLGSVMLQLLHPTSAVCGMPREESLAFLQQHESFDRAYYSGYLGPVNIQNETQIFVNLRCLQWLGEKAILYAGAGVTGDSIPEKEWEETEMKLNTLLNVIQHQG